MWKGNHLENSNRCDSPVSFEEVGFGYVLPPYSRLNVLRRHPTAEQRDVLRVRGLQSGVLEHPEAMAFRESMKRNPPCY